MIVIGVDVHKRTHTLAAVDAITGREIAQREIQATDAGHVEAIRFAADLDDEVVWALEDCRHVSRRLEQALLSAGSEVIRVPPAMTGLSRKGQRQPGKSDPIDALAVARTVIREGMERFAVAFLDEHAMEIRALHDHREQLIGERTRQINRLRFALVVLDPALEADLAPRTLHFAGAQARIRRRLAKLPQTAQARVARSELAHIVALTKEINALHADLDRLTAAHSPGLRAETGCGPICAAMLIGQTAGARRFATDAQFARQAGAAPIPASSGNTNRYRLHRGGNRQLNRALHTIALSRARNDPDTRAYLKRKRAEGKTNPEAFRCLKRHLARRIWKIMFAAAPPPSPATTRATVAVTAPALMPCIG
jgi:transposase